MLRQPSWKRCNRGAIGPAITPIAAEFQNTAWVLRRRSRQRRCKPRLGRCWGLSPSRSICSASGSGATTTRSPSRMAWGGSAATVAAGRLAAGRASIGAPSACSPQSCHHRPRCCRQARSARGAPSRWRQRSGIARCGAAGKLCSRVTPLSNCSKPWARGRGKRCNATRGSATSTRIAVAVIGRGKGRQGALPAAAAAPLKDRAGIWKRRNSEKRNSLMAPRMKEQRDLPDSAPLGWEWA